MYIKPAARKKRDQKRRQQKSFANYDMYLENGERMKRFYPITGAAERINHKCRAQKKGERRRISMSLRNARYDPEAYILDSPLADNYLLNVVHNHAI